MVNVEAEILIKEFNNNKNQYEFVEIRGCIFNNKGIWENLITLVIPKNIETKENQYTYDYGEIVFFVRRINTDAFLELVKKLKEEHKITLLELPEYKAACDNIDMAQNGYTDFIPSYRNWAFFNIPWPCKEYDIKANAGMGWPQQKLTFKKDLPTYPTLNHAIEDVLGFNFQNPSFGVTYILLPDYRIGTKLIAHSTKDIEIVVQNNTSEKEVLCKYYCKTEDEIINAEIKCVKGSNPELKFSKEIKELWLYFFDEREEVIDSKLYIYPSYNLGGVEVANDSEEYWKSVIASGENYYIEFKNSLHRNGKNHDDFIESVISFSNSDGGVIIIGVGDHGEMNGIDEEEIPIVNGLIEQLSYGCIGKRVDINYKTISIEGKKYVVLEVNSGKDKPYLIKGKTIGYVRCGSTDKLMDVNELERIYNEKYTKTSYGNVIS